jgi:hypothetical protein
VVRDALVVSAGRRRNDATVDDTGHDDPWGYDAHGTGDAAGHDAPTAAGGHVFCLTASLVMVAQAVRLPEPHRRAEKRLQPERALDSQHA